MLTAKGKAPLLPGQMLVFLAILFSFPIWAPAIGLYNYIGIEIAIWIIYALGYNLLLGYTGLPSFGHGAFLGIGAYGYGLAQTGLGAGIWSGLLIAIAGASLAAAVAACFLSHRRGIYFALMTIAIGQIFWFVAIKWHGLTGGEDGLLNVLRPEINLGTASISLKPNVALYYFVAVVLAIVMFGLWRFLHSPFGTAIQAIRMNETRARFVGYRVWLVKWAVFTLSGAFAGLAGGLFCLTQESAYPDIMSLHASGLIVMMVLIGGGFVSFWGPVVGVIVFFMARDLLGAITETWLLWYGLLFMAVMLFEPEGVAGAWARMVRRFRRSSGSAPVSGDEAAL